MAQGGLIATRPTKVGAVLKHEYAPYSGYCRSAVKVDVPAGGLQIGAVLENTTNADLYKLITDSTKDKASAIVIDTKVNDSDVKSVEITLAVLDKGPAQVADKALSFSADINTDDKKKVVYETLEALGIEVLKQV